MCLSCFSDGRASCDKLIAATDHAIQSLKVTGGVQSQDQQKTGTIQEQQSLKAKCTSSVTLELRL